jgi:hypothetical protein
VTNDKKSPFAVHRGTSTTPLKERLTDFTSLVVSCLEPKFREEEIDIMKGLHVTKNPQITHCFGGSSELAEEIDEQEVEAEVDIGKACTSSTISGKEGEYEVLAQPEVLGHAVVKVYKPFI